MQTLTLEVTDWSRSQVAQLSDLPIDMTVGEVLDEVHEAMSLPREPYHLLFDGDKLNRSTTLEELGVKSGDELTIAPEVSAGHSHEHMG
jgi:Ubiquitin-2 like Rad60 SUMO-like